MELALCYFYTATINNFQHLLADDILKMVIISSLQYFVQKKLITRYGFVIMPNHIHLLWYIHQQNGKESVAESLAKYIAHQFRKHLLHTHKLELFQSDKDDRQHQFRKRDPLAIPISSESIFISKLEYIHNNPIRPHWKLCTYPEEYRWSSARFYLEGKDEFNMLTHFRA
ncbi:transposase [Ilyomonas limi]|uniref:Transposase n=1 Tax=Ilyomonas limi TaxID=2575867 RepID=A0A4U3L5K5_9BACT|nr:transposase [Ilyomonas limi]TKK70222.1 transposase [Ilyomonas limi]